MTFIDMDILIEQIRAVRDAVEPKTCKFILHDIYCEQQYGHWIHNVDDVYKCSACGMSVHIETCTVKPLFACCPYCKTEMDEVSE